MSETTLEVVEQMRADQASVSKLFGREGRKARGAPRQMDPEMVREGLKVINGAIRGDHRAIFAFREAMTTDDFPILFGDVIDRTLLGGYRAVENVYPNYLGTREVRDFREVKLFTLDGAEGALSVVPENTEYPEAGLTEGDYSVTVSKYGRRLPFSWETHVNDDLNGFMDIVERLGRAARRTEQRIASDLYVGTDGPDGTFFAAGNANVVTGNPVLTLAALQTAMAVLAAQIDADSEPITIDVVHLVVPPALSITALNIVNALQVEMTESGGTSAQKLIARNWMAGRVQVHVDPYIPILATNNKNTSWFLFADPNENRPAGLVAFLRGNREPAVFIKEPNARRVGGGVDPFDGDFDTDAIDYKVRHVMGGTLVDPKMAVASQGDGT